MCIRREEEIVVLEASLREIEGDNGVASGGSSFGSLRDFPPLPTLNRYQCLYQDAGSSGVNLQNDNDPTLYRRRSSSPRTSGFGDEHTNKMIDSLALTKSNVSNISFVPMSRSIPRLEPKINSSTPDSVLRKASYPSSPRPTRSKLKSVVTRPHSSLPVPKLDISNVSTPNANRPSANIKNCGQHKKFDSNRPQPKSPCLKKQVLILGDSHARDLAYYLQNLLDSSLFNVFSVCRPGAKLFDVVKDEEVFSKKLCKSDFAILIAGSNDVHMDSRSVLTKEIKEKIDDLKSRTNLIILTLPPRFDKADWRSTIAICNRNLCSDSATRGCKLLGFDTFKRYHFVSQGQHLNKKGKLLLCKIIMKTVVEFVAASYEGDVEFDNSFLD